MNQRHGKQIGFKKCVTLIRRKKSLKVKRVEKKKAEYTLEKRSSIKLIAALNRRGERERMRD